MLQIRDAVQEGDGGEGAELLGDPQADIGRPGDQGGIGIGEVPVRELVAMGGAEAGGAKAGGTSRPPNPLAKGAVCPLGNPRGYFCQSESRVGFQPSRHRRSLSSHRGADDRRVAGAAAEIAREGGVVVGVGVQMGGGHRDDEAGRAKAALAGVMGNHGGLHRVSFAIRAGDTLDRADGQPVQLGQKQDAGVERF